MPPPYRNPKPIGQADTEVSNYRNSGVYGPKCIYYEISDIQNYLVSNWSSIIAGQPMPPRGYHWAVGFYPSMDNSGNLSFLVVPVMVDSSLPASDPNKIKDAFDGSTGAAAYNRNALSSGGSPNFVFDDGSLWP